MTSLYEEQQKDSLFKVYFNKTIKALDFNQHQLHQINTVNDWPILVDLVKLKTDFYRKQGFLEQGTRGSNDSLYYYTDLSLYLQKVIFDRTNAANGRYWLEENYNLYESAVQDYCNGSKQQQYQAFEVAELLKSRLLMRHLAQIGVDFTYGLPDSLIQKLQFVNNSIQVLEKKVLQEKYHKAKTDEKALLNLQESLLDMNLDKEHLLELIQKTYPKIYQLLFNYYGVSVDQVMAKLGPNDCILEYFVTNEKIYSFLITNDDFYVFTTKPNSPLAEKIVAFRGTITNFWLSANKADQQYLDDQSLYLTLAHQLYQDLIEQAAPYLKENVLIIPDQSLCLLPFEALIEYPNDHSNQFTDQAYLIRKYKISYDYSATKRIALNENSGKQKAPKRFIGYAPHFNASHIKSNADYAFFKRSIISTSI